MSAKSVLEEDLIAASEAGSGKADADQARAAIAAAQATAFEKYCKTVFEGGSITTSVPGTGLVGYSGTPITGSATGSSTNITIGT